MTTRQWSLPQSTTTWWRRSSSKIGVQVMCYTMMPWKSWAFRMISSSLCPYNSLHLGMRKWRFKVLWHYQLAVGEEPKTTTTMVDFMVVKVPSAYNVLLWWPSQNALRVMGYSSHLKVKFPTFHGIGVMKRDQQVVRQCYNTTVKLKRKESA